MSLVEVTLTLHAIEQLISIFGSRCRYTGNLYTVISVIGKVGKVHHFSLRVFLGNANDKMWKFDPVWRLQPVV